jgi:hypothetical protein
MTYKGLSTNSACLDEHVEIFGQSRLTVRGDRVTADEDEPYSAPDQER